jgi:hypothetical protein
MVRSTATSWKIGLAVAASALLSWQLPALADDKSAQELQIRPQSLEPKAVPVTLLPPASDTFISSWQPWPMKGVPIIMVRPAENAAIAQPRPEQVEAVPIAVRPAEDAAIVQPRPELVEAAPFIAQPPENAAIAQPRPEQVEAAPFIAQPAMVQPAENGATVQPSPEPEKIREGAALVETRRLAEQRPRLALLTPDSNAATASPRPEPAKTQNEAAPVTIPSLPGRSPFRQTPVKRGTVENGPNTAATTFGQQALDPAPAKGNAASRFLSNLWPGKKAASTPASSAQGSPPSAGDGTAGSPGPSAASTSAQAQAEADPKSDKPAIKRFVDGIQFWKK